MIKIPLKLTKTENRFLHDWYEILDDGKPSPRMYDIMKKHPRVIIYNSSRIKITNLDAIHELQGLIANSDVINVKYITFEQDGLCHVYVLKQEFETYMANNFSEKLRARKIYVTPILFYLEKHLRTPFRLGGFQLHFSTKQKTDIDKK